MKKTKLTLGAVALLSSVAVLTGCNKPSANDKGSILTYTDAAGNVVSYSAEELLADYEKQGSTSTTYFDKIYEVLIRKYYSSDAKSAALENLKKEATRQVLADENTARSNATSNGTSYQEEFETILKSNSCKTVDELFQHHLYQLEKSDFEDEYYSKNIKAIRDGSSQGLLGENDIFPADVEGYGVGNDGWIKSQMPYHFRHILVKVSAENGAYTQGKISEESDPTKGGEATKLASVIFQLAGATSDGTTAGTKADPNRKTFGEIAYSQSEDTSNTAFGELDIVTKVMANDYVPEFKLGAFAFDTLYNQAYTSESATTWAKENLHRLTPGLKKDAASQSDVDADQVLNDGTTINDFFKDKGIGTIPFGAAVALYNAAKVTADENGDPVNDGNAAFYPRNVLFNKYFNKHNICVITPHDVPYNNFTADTVGSWSSSFADDQGSAYQNVFSTLPGFKTDTTGIVNVGGSNVLTDSEGQIVLAVRAGASSYQGIHFIVVQRDPFSQFGTTAAKDEDGNVTKVTENVEDKTASGIANLADYYNTTYPGGGEDYPTYVKEGVETPVPTYVNYNQLDTAKWRERASTVTSAVKSYNSSLQTYIFQQLVKDQSIQFTNPDVEAKIKKYTSISRDSKIASDFETWAKNWKTYAEMIQAQDEARALGASTETGTLISEYCAIGYKKHAGDAWNTQKGVCYYAK